MRKSFLKAMIILTKDEDLKFKQILLGYWFKGKIYITL